MESFDYNKYQAYIDDRTIDITQTSKLVAEAEKLVFSVSTIEEYPNYSSESLSSFATNILRNIGNVLYRLGTAHKAFIGLFKALAFTELDEYKRLYRLNYNSVVELPYYELMKTEVPTPRYMSGTYLDTLVKNVACLQALDMENRIKQYKADCNNVLSSLGSEKQKSIIHGFYYQDASIKQIEKFFDVYNKAMSGGDQKSKTFNKVFLNNEEYKKFITLLEVSQKYLYGAHSVAVTLEDCYKSIDDIIAKIKSSPEGYVSKEELAILSSGCLQFAKFIDMYGVVCKDLLSIDHNFVEYVKQVYKHVVKK